jgi:Cysteine dioxygenase type I
MPSLQSLKQSLEQASSTTAHPLTAEDVMEILGRNLPDWSEIEPLVPHDNPYGRVTLFENEVFEVMIGCWDEGNWCDAHDHGPSVGAVYAYMGEIEHTSYALHDGVLEATERCCLSKDDLMPLGLGMIHSLTNIRSREPFVGLHVYSPPTSNVRVFHIATGDIYHVTNDQGAWVPTDPKKIKHIEKKAFRFRNLSVEETLNN